MTLNEKISAWFEPKPTTPPWKDSTARLMLHVINHDTWKGTYSQKYCWLWDGVHWQPLEWDTDESANARLLDKMIKGFISEGLTLAEAYFVVCEEVSAFMRNDRKEGVVKTFCDRVGIEEDV